MMVKVNSIAVDAYKGAKGYDLLEYTAKALAWAIGIAVPLVAVILWLIEHYKG